MRFLFRLAFFSIEAQTSEQKFSLDMEDTQIIEAIESKSYQHAQSLIKLKTSKYPQSSYYVALQLYLYQHQRNPETFTKSVDLLNKFPTDLRTTGILFKIFNQLGKDKESNLVYENLVKRFPNNCEDNLLQWFENALKLHDLKMLQKASMNLMKTNPKNNKYKFWTGLSCFLLSEQYKDNDDKQYQLFRTLGSRVIENPTTTHELFVMSQLVSENRVDVIEQFMKSQPLDLDLKLIYLDLLMNESNWEKLYEYSYNLIFKEEFNDFNTWKKFLQCSYKLGKDYNDIENKILQYPKSRNQRLALIELSQVYENDNFKKYIREYYDQYKGKLSCFSDLKLYNHEFLELQTPTDEINIKNLNNDINNIKLKPFDEIENWKIYKKYLPLIEEKVETDFYMANDLVLSNVLNQIRQSNGSIESIVKGIIYLNKITTYDPRDFRIQLWLMKFYQIINLNDLQMEIFETIKIRMLQIDSLGHFVIDKLSYLSPTKNNLNFLINQYRFYLTCEQDLNENLIKAFDKQVYNKIPNFLSFNKKLKNSFQYYEILMKIWQIIRFQNDNNYELYFRSKIMDIDSDLILSDNRDESILFNNLPFEHESFKYESFQLTSEIKLKFEILKEQFIISPNDLTFKKFNKFFEMNVTKLNDFDIWCMKIYSNLFKFKIKPNERQSLKNFITKNFKLGKITFPENYVSKEFNYIWFNIYEIYKYMIKLNDVDLNKVGEALFKELQTQDYRNRQKAHLLELKHKMINEKWEIDINKEFIDQLFDRFNDSLVKSSYLNYK